MLTCKIWCVHFDALVGKQQATQIVKVNIRRKRERVQNKETIDERLY
jgi:hypothetical protein